MCRGLQRSIIMKQSKEASVFPLISLFAHRLSIRNPNILEDRKKIFPLLYSYCCTMAMSKWDLPSHYKSNLHDFDRLEY